MVAVKTVVKPVLANAEALLRQVLRFQDPADAVIGRYFRERKHGGSRDRVLLGDVVYAVLRRLSALKLASKGGPGSIESRLALLAWPLEQREWLGLDAPTREWLDAAHKRLLEADAAPDGQHDLPPWLADALRAEAGQGFSALATSLMETASLDLRVNVLKAKRDEIQSELASLGIENSPTPYSPWGLRVVGKPSLSGLDALKDGRVEVQDEGSQLLALLTDAKRGEMVADFCAGGGGKTLALGAMMRNTGRLYAMDVSASRLATMGLRLTKSGLDTVYTMALEGEADARLSRLAGKMDRVLVDAPCTGIGTLRRHPDLKWRLREMDVASMAARQSAILIAAAKLVKPGGRLVYATCSLLSVENEDVVKRFLTLSRGFVVEDAAALLRGVKVEGDGLVKDGALRLWPHIHGTDGFYAAALRREA